MLFFGTTSPSRGLLVQGWRTNHKPNRMMNLFNPLSALLPAVSQAELRKPDKHS